MPEAHGLPFQKHPICGREMVEKEVEKLLRGGVHTAIVKVKAEVCLRCGQRLYGLETVMRFEQIRSKLERRDVSGFKPTHWPVLLRPIKTAGPAIDLNQSKSPVIAQGFSFALPSQAGLQIRLGHTAGQFATLLPPPHLLIAHPPGT